MSKEEDIKQKKELEQIFGTNRANPYGTSDYDVFVQNLDGMSLRKLKELANAIGIVGEWSEKGIKTALKKRFKSDNRNYNQVTDLKPRKFNIDREDEETKKLFDL